MISFPNCKINIGLNIVGKRPDNYHDIETIFYPLTLCDALEVIPAVNKDSDKDEFSMVGIKLNDDPEKNLCMKALRLMQKELKIKPLKIILLKKIPIGAGLGGGSSDAVFMLKMLKSISNANLPDEKIFEMCSLLGSDCAFFMVNQPVYASGKGDQFSQVPVKLKGLTIIIVKPPVFVSTAEAYAGTNPVLPKHSLKELIQLPVNRWREVIKNDFEETIFLKYPEIATIKSLMYNMGAIYASMSGSGSSVFGIFDRPVNASKDFPGCFYHEEKII